MYIYIANISLAIHHAVLYSHRGVQVFRTQEDGTGMSAQQKDPYEGGRSLQERLDRAVVAANVPDQLNRSDDLIGDIVVEVDYRPFSDWLRSTGHADTRERAETYITHFAHDAVAALGRCRLVRMNDIGYEAFRLSQDAPLPLYEHILSCAVDYRSQAQTQRLVDFLGLFLSRDRTWTHSREPINPAQKLPNIVSSEVLVVERDGFLPLRGVVVGISQRTVEEIATTLTALDLRYQNLFDSSPIMLREESMLEVWDYYDELEAEHGMPSEQILAEHPELFHEAAKLVRRLRTNQADYDFHKTTSGAEIVRRAMELRGTQVADRLRATSSAFREGKGSGPYVGLSISGDGELAWLLITITPSQKGVIRPASFLTAQVDVTQMVVIEETEKAIATVFSEGAPSPEGVLRAMLHVLGGDEVMWRRCQDDRCLDLRVRLGAPMVESITSEQPMVEIEDQVVVRRSGDVTVLKGTDFFTIQPEKCVALSCVPAGPDECDALCVRFHKHPWRAKDLETVWLIFAQALNSALRMQETERDRAAHNQILEELVAQRTSELEELYRGLESFSYSVSHDLRAPIRHVSLRIQEILDREGGLTEESIVQLGEIQDFNRRMTHLISDLLRFSQISRVALHHSVVNLDHLVAGIIRRQLKPNRDVRFEVEPLGTIVADVRLVEIVLTNLIDNAVKYSSRQVSPIVSIRVEVEENQPWLVVQDNGIGFRANSLWPFEPFRRLEGTQDIPGSGVGLSLAHRIVERHHGQIEARSEPGEGATFRCHFGQHEPGLQEEAFGGDGRIRTGG